MGIQHTQFSDISAPAFSLRLADKTGRERLGLSDSNLRDKHVAFCVSVFKTMAPNT